MLKDKYVKTNYAGNNIYISYDYISSTQAEFRIQLNNNLVFETIENGELNQYSNEALIAKALFSLCSKITEE